MLAVLTCVLSDTYKRKHFTTIGIVRAKLYVQTGDIVL